MLHNNPPPRNRLLALEQELQTRRSPGIQQKRHEAPRPINELGQALFVDPRPVPSPSIQPRPTQHATSPPPHSSPWQALAARLSHNQPTWDVAFSTEAAFTPPQFNQSIHQSIHHNVSRRSSKTTGKRSSFPSQGNPSAKALSPHVTASTPPNIPNDEQPVGGWQDLAAQLHQARSPQLRSRSSHSSSQNSQNGAESSELDHFSQLSLPALPGQPESTSLSITVAPITDEPSQDFIEAEIEEWEQNDQMTLPSIATATALNVADDETPLESWQNLAAQLHQARSPQPRSSTPLLPAARTEVELIEIDDADVLSLPALPAQLESTSFSIAAAPTPDILFQDLLEAEIETEQDDKQSNSATTSAITSVIPASTAIVLSDEVTGMAIVPFTSI